MRNVIHAPRPMADYGRAARVIKPPFRGRLTGLIGSDVIVRLYNNESARGRLTHAGPTYSGVKLADGSLKWAKNDQVSRVVVK